MRIFDLFLARFVVRSALSALESSRRRFLDLGGTAGVGREVGRADVVLAILSDIMKAVIIETFERFYIRMLILQF